MGLEIFTGEYASTLKEGIEEAEYIDSDLKVINSFLLANNIQQHVEPKVLPEVELSCASGFPYCFLHYLRRVYALNVLGKEVSPVSGELTEEDKDLISQVYEVFESHLLCHSDNEGYYVPIAFEDVIADEELPGIMLGSTQTLLKEIIEISSFIGVEVIDSEISDVTRAKLIAAEVEHPFYPERLVWFSLYEHCKNSLKNKTVISFD